jgi:hypothetical protein
LRRTGWLLHCRLSLSLDGGGWMITGGIWQATRQMRWTINNAHIAKQKDTFTILVAVLTTHPPGGLILNKVQAAFPMVCG